jgi:S-methylmethionine-dependent homocysteine/selenocysteine methylase
MAAPERFAEMSDSSCTAGAVHTWHLADIPLIASAVLATPIDVIAIEAILLTAISPAAAIRAVLSDSSSRASVRKSLREHRNARHSIR